MNIRFMGSAQVLKNNAVEIQTYSIHGCCQDTETGMNPAYATVSIFIVRMV